MTERINKEFLNTTKKQKISEVKKEVEKYMNEENYLIVCVKEKEGIFKSYLSGDHMNVVQLSLFFEDMLKQLNEQSQTWQETK